MLLLIKETRLAVRHFLRHPGLATVVIVTLGLATGLAVGMSSVVHAVLIAPLPFPEPERLVELSMQEAARAGLRLPMSAPTFRAIRDHNRSLEAVAATFRENLNLSLGGVPERVAGARVSASFFEVMGALPELGRGFREAEDAADGDPVVVISHGLWQRRFAGTPAALGARIVVDGEPRSVVGVAPAGFSYPGDSEMWLPLAIDWSTESRSHGWLVPVARLARGVGLDQARADLDRLAKTLEATFPDDNRDRGLGAVPLHDVVVGELRPSLLLLSAAVACVLLIAAANVSILLMVHAVGRQREIAVRQALGARRLQLVRQLLVEGLTLAGGGALLGLVLARGITRLVQSRCADLLPHGRAVGLDPQVIGFALALTVGMGLAVAALPALRSFEGGITSQLKQSAQAVAGRGSQIGRTLVVLEIAVAVALVAAALLLGESFVKLRQVDPGFDSSNVLTAEVSLSGPSYGDDAARAEFFRLAVGEIAALPGVRSVGTIYPLPLHGRRVSTSVAVEGVDADRSPGRQPLVDLRFVSPGYLDASGLRLVSGRFVSESDTADAPQAIVVNQSFVRSLMPPGDPIGRRVTGDDPGDPQAEWQTVVGVVEDVRHVNLAEESGPEMYVPVAQLPFEWASFVVRLEGASPESVTPSLRRAIRRIDPELPLFNVQPLSAVVSHSLDNPRLVTALLALFAAIGLGLAGIGVFSVVSFTTRRRLREMAIRMALGGSPAAVRRLVVRQALLPALVGTGLGFALAGASARLLASRLFGVSAADPLTHAAVAALILTTAFVASWLPACRAARVEPAVLLRSE